MKTNDKHQAELLHCATTAKNTPLVWRSSNDFVVISQVSKKKVEEEMSSSDFSDR